jgi:hypothetical protein
LPLQSLTFKKPVIIKIIVTNAIKAIKVAINVQKYQIKGGTLIKEKNKQIYSQHLIIMTSNLPMIRVFY